MLVTRDGLARRVVRLLGLTVIGAAIVAAGTLGVTRWRVHRSFEAGMQLLADGDAAGAARTLVNVLAARPDAARLHLSAPSVPEHEARRAESSRSEILRSVVVSARLPLRSVLPRAALAPAGVDLCSSPSPEDG